MKKNINKDQIVDMALELMRDKSDFGGLNLREVARNLGCAHTNLYNYFPSYNDLLWETHTAVQGIFIDLLREKLDSAKNHEEKMEYFFEGIVEMYLNNKGWFKLSWHEYIDGIRPMTNIEACQEANRASNEMIAHIWKELYGFYPEENKMKKVLHNTHCYIIGEISNYILGRGIIEEEEKLIAYVSGEAVLMFKLCLENFS